MLELLGPLVVAAGLAAVGLRTRALVVLSRWGPAKRAVRSGWRVALFCDCFDGLLPGSIFVCEERVSVRRGELVIFGEPLAEHRAEPVGLLHVGQVPAVGEQRQPPPG